jgi:hypothetical protein
MKVSFIRNGNLRRKVGDNALGVEGYPVPLLCNIILAHLQFWNGLRW